MITRSLRLLVASHGTWEHFSVADRPTTMKQRVRLAVVLVATVSVAAHGGSGESSTPPAHPALECSGDGSGTGNYNLTGPGFATAAEALADRLGYYEGLYGGEIIELADNEADGNSQDKTSLAEIAAAGVAIRDQVCVGVAVVPAKKRKVPCDGTAPCDCFR